MLAQVGLPNRVLFIETEGHPLLKDAVCRGASLPAVLERFDGTYAFFVDDAWSSVIVGSEFGQPTLRTRQSQMSALSPILVALLLLQTRWELAVPTDLAAPLFKPGDGVEVLGQQNSVGTVAGAAIRTPSGWQYPIRFGRETKNILESGLQELDILDSPNNWTSLPLSSLEEFTSLLSLEKLQQPLSDVLYSYGRTRTVFRAYQFKPLLKLLQTHSQRLLIADEVGLGKTIEAGLIWSELQHREGIRRGLVVCPAALTRKWQSEMKRRFDVDLDILDRSGLAEFVAQLEVGEDPQINAVISIESIRSAPALEELDTLHPRFDLVIVDEAHALRNAGNQSYKLGQRLSDWADVLLFLSATPLNLGQDDLFNLLNLLAEDQFPLRQIFPVQLAPNRTVNQAAKLLANPATTPAEILATLDGLSEHELAGQVTRRPQFEQLIGILTNKVDLSTEQRSECKRLLAQLNTLAGVVTRTRKVDVPDNKATRRAHSIGVSWTETETRLYLAVLDWARARALQNNGIVGFAAIMPLRQAASCLPAMRELLKDKYGISHSSPDSWPESDDFDEFEEAEDDSDDQQASEEFLSSVQLQRALFALGETDTKFDRFKEQIDQMRDLGINQVMVFSFFRRTLSYLATRLRADYKVRVMDGKVKPDERARIMESFRRGEFEILLLSEVGAEGLDFEFVSALVNYDLPWNPMRIEQRIGRIDRFGQTSEVLHIYNFHVPGTIETDILERLYQRINVFEQSIGELEPILRDELTSFTRAILDPRRSLAEQVREIDRIALATENRRSEIAQLEAQSDGLMTGVDELLVDGLETSIRSAGRYVGAAEIRQIIERFVTDFSGSLKKPRPGQLVYEIKGSTDLEQKLVSLGQALKIRRLIDISPRLRAGESLYVVFDNEDAMKVSADLISLSHPLLTAARHYLDSQFVNQWRHGSITVTGEGADEGAYLTLFFILEVTGSSPIREMRSVSIDTASGDRNDIVGEFVLRAIAEGIALPGAEVPDVSSAEIVTLLEAGAAGARDSTFQSSQMTNEAIVSSREQTLRNTFEFKINKVSETLRKMDGGANPRIVAMHDGNKRNLEARLNASLEELDRQRQLAATWRPVALAHVTVVAR